MLGYRSHFLIPQRYRSLEPSSTKAYSLYSVIRPSPDAIEHSLLSSLHTYLLSLSFFQLKPSKKNVLDL